MERAALELEWQQSGKAELIDSIRNLNHKRVLTSTSNEKLMNSLLDDVHLVEQTNITAETAMVLSALLAFPSEYQAHARELISDNQGYDEDKRMVTLTLSVYDLQQFIARIKAGYVPRKQARASAIPEATQRGGADAPTEQTSNGIAAESGQPVTSVTAVNEACPHCGKKGHPPTECWSLRPELRPIVARLSREGSLPSPDTQERLPRSRQWVISALTPVHFTWQKELLCDYKVEKVVNVKDPLGGRCEARGKGTVTIQSEIDGKISKVLVRDVYFVPDATCNVISTLIMDQKGFEGVHCGGVYSFRKPGQPDFMRALRKGPYFVIEMDDPPKPKVGVEAARKADSPLLRR